MSTIPLPLLLISNGHGEDACAAAWAEALRARGASVEGLPLVGAGSAYRERGVPLVGPRALPPSGGFAWGRPRAMLEDLRAGLAGAHLAQLRFLFREARAGRWSGVLAVGDVLPLALAAGTGLPYGFYGAFQSDAYARPGRSAFHPLDRRLMRRARLVAARDAGTAEGLRRHGVAAVWHGNLMMDGLANVPEPPPGADAVALLPGSRAPEALGNLERLLGIAARLGAERSLTAHLAWALEAPVPPEALARVALAPAGPGAWDNGAGLRLVLHPRDFGGAIAPAAFTLAMAGTATEQAAGLGRPAVVLAGPGPQCTPGFVRAQGKLLGAAVAPCFDPRAAFETAAAWRTDVYERERRGAAGRERMGPPGAAGRLAAAWLEAPGAWREVPPGGRLEA